MAILKGLEGQAHVKSTDDLANWSGYIILAPDFRNIRYFDTAGPAAAGVYEDPVMIEGKYYFANGNTIVRNVNFTSSELRVDFVGNGKLNIIHSFSTPPADYIL